jgi:hypothetical protein
VRRKVIDSTSLECSTLEVYLNLKKRGQSTVLAICDAELLGQTLNEGRIVFEVREEFYKGTRTSVEEAVDLIEQSTIVNMVGKGIVKKAIEKGLIHPEAVLNISGVPHAQIVRL